MNPGNRAASRWRSRLARGGKIRVGFVGCGGFVRGNHLPNIAAERGFVVRALCDLDRGNLDRLAKRYRAALVTTDYRELVADPEVDLVVLGTGPALRVPVVKEAALRGKALFIEKPMGLGWKDTREVLRILEERPVPCMVGMNRPYSRIMRETRRVFRAVRRGPTLVNYRIVSEDRLWPARHRRALRSGQSTIIHELVHVFDLLNWLVGALPVRVYATGGRADNHVLVLGYPDGTQASVVSGGCGTEGFPKEQMEIFTNHAAIRMSDFVELNVAQVPGEEDRRFPVRFRPKGPRAGLSEAALRRELKAWRRRLAPAQIAKGFYYDVRVCVDKGHRDEIRCLRDCLLGGRPIPTGPRRGAEAVFVGLKALESLASGRPVDLDWPRLMGRRRAPGGR
jgi:predicted dehydrogenase